MAISQVDYFILFVISYVLVGLLTPLMRKIALAQGVLDRPNSAHKSHKNPVPYLGGVAIIIGVVIVSYIALISNNFTWSNFWLATSVLGPAVVMGLVGLWDDIKSLNPLPRFIGQTIAGIVVAIILILNDNIGNPTGITAISLTYLAITGDQYFIAALSIVVAGSTLGFLIWNRAPARIYMGDAGALFLGLLIATLTIRFKPSADNLVSSFAIPVLLLAIPILDTTVAVFSRLRRKVSPFQGGKDHLSHRLVRSGFSRKLSAITLWSLTGLFSFFAVLVSRPNNGHDVVIVLTSLVFWLLLFIYFFRTNDD